MWIRVAKISVYYDYFNDKLCPMWMIIWFGKGKIPWDKNYIYVPINCPFKRKMAEEFVDNMLSISIAAEELTVNPQREGCFGIHLPTVLKRLSKTRGDMGPYDFNDIEQFIIQMGDIEEIIAMDRYSIFAWR